MKLPQVTLRDLFWLVLVVSLVLGWLASHWRMKQLIADSEKAFRDELTEMHRRLSIEADQRRLADERVEEWKHSIARPDPVKFPDDET
jgi:hypothetical protein